MKQKTISARLPKDLAETLKKATTESNITKCALLNFLITSFVNLQTAKGALSPHLERLRIVLERGKEEGRHYDIKENCSTISTKIEETYYYQFEAIAERQEITKGALICELVASVLKFMDVPEGDEAGRNLTKEIKAFTKRLRENKKKLSKKLHSTKKRRGTDALERCETAIYFMRDKTNKLFAVEVTECSQKEKPFQITYSAKRILRRVMEVCFPTLAKRLKAIAEHTDTNSFIETITALVETEEGRAESRYIESLFLKNDTDEYGHSLTPIKYKPLNRKNSYLVSERI